MAQPVNVTLTPMMNGSSFSAWQMSIQGEQQLPPGTFPPLQVQHGDSADFTFTIHNPPGQNITFASFLVPAKNTDIHHISKPVNGQTTLTFKDHNLHVGDIPYEILFNGAPKLDPIIDNNGGGNIWMYNAVEYGAAAATLVIGLLVGLLLQKKFRLI